MSLKFEEKVNFMLIVKVTAINSAYLFIVFMILLSTLSDFRLAFLYSLLAQIISLIVNGIFWVRWTFVHMDISADAKLGLSTLVVISLMSGIIFLVAMTRTLSFLLF